MVVAGRGGASRMGPYMARRRRADEVRNRKIVAGTVYFVLVPQPKHERRLAMATTSYLYHTLGLTSYHHEKTEFREGADYYHVSKKKEAWRCAHCHA